MAVPKASERLIIRAKLKSSFDAISFGFEIFNANTTINNTMRLINSGAKLNADNNTASTVPPKSKPIL